MVATAVRLIMVWPSLCNAPEHDAQTLAIDTSEAHPI